MKYTKEYLKANNIAIQCNTPEYYDNVKAMLQDSINNYWTVYMDETCLSYYSMGGSLGYSRKTWFKDKGCTIITAQEFLADRGILNRNPNREQPPKPDRNIAITYENEAEKQAILDLFGGDNRLSEGNSSEYMRLTEDGWRGATLNYARRKKYIIKPASDYLERDYPQTLDITKAAKTYGVSPATTLLKQLTEKETKTMKQELNLDLTKTLTANIEVEEALASIETIKINLESSLRMKRELESSLEDTNKAIKDYEAEYKKQVAIVKANTKVAKKKK